MSVYNDILVKVGDFGLYQKLLCCIFVFYTTFLCGLNYYTQVGPSLNLDSMCLPGVHIQHPGAPLLGP